MSDAELVKACAEKVMGWHQRAEKTVGKPDNSDKPVWADETGYYRGHVASFGEWNPLTDDTASAQVLDKMAADGWNYTIASGCKIPGKPGSMLCVFKRIDERGDCFTDDRKRAVVLAALKAVGVDVGE